MGNYTRSPYHSRAPEWRNNFNKVGSYIGIEFELESRTGYRAVLGLLPDFGNRWRPVTEEDGSLSTDCGLEIVFPPFRVATLKKKNSSFARAITAISSQVTNSPRAGMHLNVNTNGWANRKKQQFMAVLHNLPQSYLESIGQRPLNSYCEQSPGRSIEDYADVDGHHILAGWKTRCVEVRFPRSTTNLDRINDLIEFLGYVELYAGTVDMAALLSTPRHTPFRRTRANYPGTCDCLGCVTQWIDGTDNREDANYTAMRRDFIDNFMSKGKRRSRILGILTDGYTT